MNIIDWAALAQGAVYASQAAAGLLVILVVVEAVWRG